MVKVLAKLSEKHPRESEIAKVLLEPYRGLYMNVRSINISAQRADDLEMKICEALVEAYCRGVEAP